MNKGAKILNFDSYRKAALSDSASRPYRLLQLLKKQNWLAKREFAPRVSIRISAFTPCGRPAVKIKL